MTADTSNKNNFGMPKPDFQNPKRKGPDWRVIMIIVGIVLVLGADVTYHLYSTKQENAKVSLPESESQAKDEQSTNSSETISPVATQDDQHEKSTLNEATDTKADLDKALSDNESFEFKDKNSTQNNDNITSVAQQLEENRKNPRPLVKPGTYQELSSPQGIYHLVVVSHLDKKSAIKSVQRLMKKNMGVCLILPRKDEKYYRVTIGHSKTHHEAEQKLKQLASEYEDLFILKY
ncbi:SPOR domain-containing protein [Cardinium endosymbiont of Culicoides punctatus]|uniref:SPOR domain-containing protein n=1 Tax=Cardinium endosymbiont of Culicoides punctatus TaxID=2304601 RepID=UPI00105849AF|nr:SPOR domain-containing protein [Cardinium endosymbiont of Culicoides punctatus]TDG95536.1 hypothetical protein CCPUN_02720 [Cardinium endosymbiont of Culicoides punctatus]